jgi:hypothetical protein
MSDSHSNNKRWSSRHTLTVVIAAYLVALIGAVCAIWFELPTKVAFALRVASLLAATLAAVCVGRAVAGAQELMAFRERTSISGRGAGVLMLVALGSLAIVCTKWVSPRSWPATVDEALAILDTQLDDESKRKLAYMGYDDLIELHHGWGTSIRNKFGMLEGNEPLLRDCDPEYVHADTCSTVIISRLWKKVRAELPPTPRRSLEVLEAKMNRTMVPPRELKERPLKDVVATFDIAIRAQLPEDARFAIRYDTAYADEPVSWHEREPITFHDALGRLSAKTGLYVKRSPPDVLLEPYWKPLSPAAQQVTQLKALLAVEHGLREESRRLITDEAEWTKAWSGLPAQSSARPQIDFRRNSLLFVSLGERPSTGYEIAAIATGIGDPELSLLATEVKPGKTCITAKHNTHPTSIFIVPAVTDDAQIVSGHDTKECTDKNSGASS